MEQCVAGTLTGYDICMCVCLCLCTEQSKVALMCEREQCAGVKLGGPTGSQIRHLLFEIRYV